MAPRPLAPRRLGLWRTCGGSSATPAFWRRGCGLRPWPAVRCPGGGPIPNALGPWSAGGSTAITGGAEASPSCEAGDVPKASDVLAESA